MTTTTAALFAAYLTENSYGMIDEEDLVECHDTADDFYNATIECQKRMPAVALPFGTFTELRGTQRRKGEPRCDLLILEVDDKTYVYKS